MVIKLVCVGRGSLILAWRLLSLLDISAASPSALLYLRGLPYLRGLAGRPNNKPARRPTKKPALTAARAHKREKI